MASPYGKVGKRVDLRWCTSHEVPLPDRWNFERLEHFSLSAHMSSEMRFRTAPLRPVAGGLGLGILFQEMPEMGDAQQEFSFEFQETKLQTPWLGRTFPNL